MLDKLIDFVLQILDDLYPFVVIKHYEEGVRLRLGKAKGKLEPGIHWKVPFADTILTHMIKTTTMGLYEQTLTTRDWQDVVVKATVKYEVNDVEILLLEVNDPIDALSDMSQGIIRNCIIKRDWATCNEESLETEITQLIKKEARKWGLKVDKVTLTDLGLASSFRIFNSGKHLD